MTRRPYELLLAAAWCIALATIDFDREWIFQLSKWFLCAVAIVSITKRWTAGKRESSIGLAILAVIFNPLRPIEFRSSEWVWIDWIAAGVFLCYWPEWKPIALLFRHLGRGIVKMDEAAIWMLGFALLIGSLVLHQKLSSPHQAPAVPKKPSTQELAKESVGIIGSYGYPGAPPIEYRPATTKLPIRPSEYTDHDKILETLKNAPKSFEDLDSK